MRALSWLAIASIMVAAGVLAIVVYRERTPSEQEAVLGMVRQTEIRIAPEITGRLATLKVRPGAHVTKGEIVAIIDNPELAASVEEARAALASAQADRERVYSGVRAEEVGIAAQAVQTAEANLVLARAQNSRIVTLASQGNASRQQLDESNATLVKSEADLDLKRAEYGEASAGPTAEERTLANAKVTLAEAELASLEAQFDKTTLASPSNGIVGIQIAEPGEILVPGRPVMIIEAADERWFGFTLREDTIGGLIVGGEILLTDSDRLPIRARITELRPLGEFATWRAARAVGDHDLNSFRLRAEPVDPGNTLEPGMTVWLPEKR